ncbi:hypothetical protein D1872_264870 [compost metagenome]
MIHTPQIDAAAFRERAVHQFFVVRAFQETVRKTAREALLQFANLFLAWTGIVAVEITVDRLAVFADHVCHVFRRFEAAFDFEGRHARFDQFRHQVNRGQILRRQKIRHIAHRFVFAIHH